MEKIIKRFQSFYKIINNCFVWQGYKDKDGYGTFYFKKKNRKAHRVSYYIKFGNIPKDMVIDHICKNPSCVNPKHLRLVTKRQNTMENSNSVGVKNARKTHCKEGHLFDKKYGTKKQQRYCSICENEKSKRLAKKWRKEANSVLC